MLSILKEDNGKQLYSQHALAFNVNKFASIFNTAVVTYMTKAEYASRKSAAIFDKLMVNALIHFKAECGDQPFFKEVATRNPFFDTLLRLYSMNSLFKFPKHS